MNKIKNDIFSKSIKYSVFGLFSVCFITSCQVVPHTFSFPDPATFLAYEMMVFHYILLCLMVFISCVVFYIYGVILFEFSITTVSKDKEIFAHSSELEATWTIIPGIILYYICVVSFGLLYTGGSILGKPVVTLKAIGHQWYWEYEHSDFAVSYQNEFPNSNITFSEYNIDTADLKLGEPRLLTTTTPIVLPVKVPVRLLVTSEDVIHSWTVPQFGIKLDATPGRISEVIFEIARVGTYYGQCSEICGVNHGFMPIQVKALNLSDYVKLTTSNLKKGYLEENLYSKSSLNSSIEDYKSFYTTISYEKIV